MSRLHAPKHLEELLRTVRAFEQQQGALLKAHSAKHEALGKLIGKAPAHEIARMEVMLNHQAPFIERIRR